MRRKGRDEPKEALFGLDFPSLFLLAWARDEASSETEHQKVRLIENYRVEREIVIFLQGET